MYSSSSSSMDMGEGIAFVSPPALPVAAEESSPPPAIPIVVRSPLHHQQEAPTTTEAGRDQDQHGANSAHTIAKGKRTKRPRTSPPSAAHQQPTPTSSASNSCYSGGSGAITEEEEDMANCLILLAQGDPNGAAVNNIKQHEERATGNAGRATSRRFAETSGCASTKAGFYVYECKTCSRCFSTFQALGGHRASHKKPKVESCYGVGGHHDVLLESEEKTRPLEHVMIDEHHRPQQEQRPSMLESQIKPTTTTARPQQEQRPSMLESQIKPTTTTASSTPSKITHNNISTITNNKSTATARIHECSICGSEFQSGQALGGHMRRHRAAAAVPASPPSQLSQQVLLPFQKPAEPTTKSVVLPLDLNLPAPSEDADFPKAASPASLPPPTFPFSVPSKRPPMLFSASPLVDCHY